jgi:hypothetical protein
VTAQIGNEHAEAVSEQIGLADRLTVMVGMAGGLCVRSVIHIPALKIDNYIRCGGGCIRGGEFLNKPPYASIRATIGVQSDNSAVGIILVAFRIIDETI